MFAVHTVQQAVTGSQFMSTAQVVTDMTSSGPLEVTLHLAHAVTNLFDMFEIMPIVDRETYADMAKGTKVIGTGPFMFDTYSPGNTLTLKRNPNYWQAGRPYLDQVVVRTISQSQALVDSLLSGETDMIVDISPPQTAGISGGSYKVTVLNPRDAGYYVASNVKVDPLNNNKVRQAIAWAINRTQLNQQVFNSAGLVTSLPWSRTNPAYNAGQADTYSYHPDKAKSLLKEAGATGLHLEFAMSSVEPTSDALAQVVEFNLGQAGITVTPVAYDQAEFVAHLVGGTFPGLFTEVHGFGSLHPASLLKGAFPFNADHNASNFLNSTYQALVERVWTASSSAAAQAAYTAVNNFLLEQQFVSDLVNFGHIVATNTRFTGFQVNRFDYMVLANASLS